MSVRERFEYRRQNKQSCLRWSTFVYNQLHQRKSLIYIGRNPEYLHHAIGHTVSVGMAAMVLKLMPAYIKPYRLCRNGSDD